MSFGRSARWKLNVPQNSERALDSWRREEKALRGRELGRMEIQIIKGKFYLFFFFSEARKGEECIHLPPLLKDTLQPESTLWALH